MNKKGTIFEMTIEEILNNPFMTANELPFYRFLGDRLCGGFDKNVQSLEGQPGASAGGMGRTKGCIRNTGILKGERYGMWINEQSRGTATAFSAVFRWKLSWGRDRKKYYSAPDQNSHRAG